MAKQINWMARGGVAVLAFLAVGCGSGFKSVTGASGSNGSQSADVSDTINKVQAATVDAQQAMDDAKAAIASISDSNGNIKIDIFARSTAPVQTQGLLAPLVQKLRPIFDTVFNKALFVKQQFESAKAMVSEALAKLNPNDPQVAMLRAQLDQIFALEAQFSAQMHNLASKLGYALTGIDRLVSLATSFIPIPGLGMIAGTLVDMLLLGDVKDLIRDLQSKLLAL